jgi:hypothetical protein
LFSNDRSHSGDVGHEGSFRDTVGCYIHFRANGTMEPCVINAQGVNQHDLTAGRTIEAEEFFSMEGSNATKVDLLMVDAAAAAAAAAAGSGGATAAATSGGAGDAGDGGFAVGGGVGAVFRYPHITGLSARADTALTLHAASVDGAVIQVFANRQTSSAAGTAGLREQEEWEEEEEEEGEGSLLCNCEVPATGNLALFADVACTWSTSAAAATVTGGKVWLELVVADAAAAAATGQLQHHAEEAVRLDSFWLQHIAI